MPIIIDGHNLIGALPGIALGDPQDEALLVDRLRTVRTDLGSRTLLVFFDSGLLPGDGPDLSTTGIHVRFAAPGQSADDAIVHFIQSRSQPGQYSVVTNDHELGQRVRSAGASVIPADAFAERLSRRRPRRLAEKAPTGPDPRAPAFSDLYEEFMQLERRRVSDASKGGSQRVDWGAKVYGDDPAEAERAVHQLAQQEGTPEFEVILDALTHSHAQVRAAALLELGFLREPRALAAVYERLSNDPSSMVREAAAKSLGWFGERAALPALEAAAKEDPKGKVRQAAKAATEQIRARKS